MLICQLYYHIHVIKGVKASTGPSAHGHYFYVGLLEILSGLVKFLITSVQIFGTDNEIYMKDVRLVDKKNSFYSPWSYQPVICFWYLRPQRVRVINLFHYDSTKKCLDSTRASWHVLLFFSFILLSWSLPLGLNKDELHAAGGKVPGVVGPTKAPAVAGPTKDDAYDTFMREMEMFLWIWHREYLKDSTV